MKNTVKAATRLRAADDTPVWVAQLTVLLKKGGAENLKRLNVTLLDEGDEDDEAAYSVVYAATSIDFHAGKFSALANLLKAHELDVNFQTKGGKVIITVSNDLEMAMSE